MSVVVSILIALSVAVALVLVSRLWFDRFQKRAHAQRIGIEVLDTRRWREALDLLVQALASEGYSQAAEPTGPSGMPLAERHLMRDGSRVLLIYKHGTSYHIGATALLDAERRRQEAEQDEVIIATLGSVDRDALPQATRMKVTCLDGTTVWTKVREVLDPTARDGVAAEAEALVERPRRLAGVAAAVLGLAIVFWGAGLNEMPLGFSAQTNAPPPMVTTPSPAPGRTTIPQETEGGPMSTTNAAGDVGDAQRRALAAKAITALPEVERASWSSASTMVIGLRPRVSVDLGVEKTCALAPEHPVLRDVRLQMEANGGSDVRWRRCT